MARKCQTKLNWTDLVSKAVSIAIVIITEDQ